MKRKKWKGYLFVMPGFIGILIFFVIPYLDVVRRAFVQSVTGEFVGVGNFIEVFENKAFQLAAKNTVHFISVCIPILLVLSLTIAVGLMRKTRFSQFIKTGTLLPMVIPVASVVLLWQFLFAQNGWLNGVLHFLGMRSIDWMNTSYAFYILVFSYVWKNLGYCIILWMAGLTMIPLSIYEAARVDGAGEWQCFLKITLPNLKTTGFTVAVLSLINSFKVFREAYLVAGDYPNRSIYLFQHLFNNWFSDLDLDKMAAGAVLLSIVMLVMILLLWRAGEEQE